MILTSFFLLFIFQVLFAGKAIVHFRTTSRSNRGENTVYKETNSVTECEAKRGQINKIRGCQHFYAVFHAEVLDRSLPFLMSHPPPSRPRLLLPIIPPPTHSKQNQYQDWKKRSKFVKKISLFIISFARIYFCSCKELMTL